MVNGAENKNSNCRSILIIDDCHATREILSTILGSSFNVIPTANAKEGLRMLSKDVGLVFLDVVLSDMDGLEVLRQIKDARPSVPVVVITGYSTEETCIKAFRLGARDYMKKPLSPRDALQKACILMDISSGDRRRPISLLADNIDLDNCRGDIPHHIVKGILKVKNCIDRTHTLPSSLDDAYRMAGMSRTYFCYFFKLITGYSFKRYQRQVRLQFSKDLLRNRNLRISEVAEKIDYSSKYFSDAFKREFGSPPKGI